MAKILIRSSDRRIIFFTYDDTLSEVSTLFTQHYDRFPGDHEIIVTHRPPPNLRLGAYMTANLISAEPEPVEAYGVAVRRRAGFQTWLDGEIEKLSSPAILLVSEIDRQNWTRYLRMLVMASLHLEPFMDARQWALVEAAQSVSPYDFDSASATWQSRFDALQHEGGLYFVAWWDNSTKFVATKPVTADDIRLNPTSPGYDVRFASSVSLIPEDEIDRTDRTVFNPSHPWTARDETIAQINAKLSWYNLPSP